MKRRKILKTIVILGIAGLVIGGGIGLYMFNMPHRDVQSADTDFSLSASEIVSEYLNDATTANHKYLAADGDSKILEITGEVSEMYDNYNDQKVVLLKDAMDKAGVSATFTPETKDNLKGVEIGQTITVKGVIRSGATYDEDLELYENVIIDKSDIVN